MCFCSSAISLESCFTQLQCEALCHSGFHLETQAYLASPGLCHPGHTQFLGSWTCVGPVWCLLDTTVFHCPVDSVLVGQPDWNKIFIGTLFYLKSLTATQKKLLQWWKSSCFLSDHCSTDTGTWVAQSTWVINVSSNPMLWGISADLSRKVGSSWVRTWLSSCFEMSQ